MDMGMGNMGGGGSTNAPLSASGVNFSDPDQAANFLAELLDDTELQVVGNAYARYFWYGTVVVIGLASIFHWSRWLLLKRRLAAAANDQSQPARPKSAVLRYFATITAMAREATYPQLTLTRRFLWFRIPTVGTLLLLGSYLAFVLALEFINDSVTGAQFWQARGVRAGWLAVAQVPLIVLLVGKHNLIGLCTGVSYERLNVLHRWTARMTLLLAIFHFAFQMVAWNNYGLVQLEWSTDTCPPSGIAAFAVLVWINISNLPLFRFLGYEFFVVQHLLSFFGFIIAVMYHLPSTALYSRVYIYIPIVLWFLDRVIRMLFFTWNNYRSSEATLVPLDGGATKVRLRNSAITKWRPGAHVLLSIPRFGLVQSHPATIASTPSSHAGDMVFMLKSHKGFTKRIMSASNDSRTALLPHTKQESEQQQNAQVATYTALLSGPYGGSHSDFAAFDSVCLLAGSTGVTFTLAVLQDLAERSGAADRSQLPLRRVHFVWCIKRTDWVNWATAEIAAAVQKLKSAGIEAEVSIFVTCADDLTEQGGAVKECGCECDKSLGPCCCVIIDKDEDSSKDDDIQSASPKEAGVDKETIVTEKSGSTSLSSSSGIEAPKLVAVKLPGLSCANFYSGRPEVSEILTALLDGADGESAVGVCGPIGLNTTVRNTVVRLSDQRAVHKGTGAQGCYLHVESFS
ncbi:ferric reductase-like protein like transmembrane component [Teratosphaeria nubilosa]|uniref:Ferric reductase-like protein like transmembrane component n=1 Tax=Teratosphaeria nubilosa TaxID=161662 RepID=A0A6G1LBD2_9PEZI|nr:ferric reductase-like protein like transmembrane component [Teratosphaeria nubilosa]